MMSAAPYKASATNRVAGRECLKSWVIQLEPDAHQQRVDQPSPFAQSGRDQPSHADQASVASEENASANGSEHARVHASIGQSTGDRCDVAGQAAGRDPHED